MASQGPHLHPLFPLRPIEDLDPEGRDLVFWWRERVSPDTAVLGLLAHNQEGLKSYLSYLRAFVEESGLDASLIGLVWTRLAYLVHAQGRSVTTLASAEEQARAVGPGTAALSPRQQAAINFAETLALAPDSLSPEDMADLRQHFTDGEVVELGLLVSALYGTERLRAAMRM